MSVQRALDFIAWLRQPGNRERAGAEMGVIADLEQLLKFSADAGFDLTRDDLRQAHKLDYQMRFQLSKLRRQS